MLPSPPFTDTRVVSRAMKQLAERGLNPAWLGWQVHAFPRADFTLVQLRTVLGQNTTCGKPQPGILYTLAQSRLTRGACAIGPLDSAPSRQSRIPGSEGVSAACSFSRSAETHTHTLGSLKQQKRILPQF